MADLVYDPYDAALHLDPHPVWKRMRDEAPLYFNETYNFYALSRFADVRGAMLDAATFSSAHGVMLDLLDLPIEVVPKTLPFMDAPEHTRLRNLVNRTFTPRRVAELESRIRELCAGYLDPFVGAGGFDVVRDFGGKLPMMVIGSLLGIPLEDQDQLRQWADRIFERPAGAGFFEYDFEVMGLFHEYCVTLAEARRREPADDIMTALGLCRDRG